MEHTLDTLADQVNAWCEAHRVRPANGQASTELTVRTLRYYRTVNLLDAPAVGGGHGYGMRHFLQACAVRVLQAQGLPLSRIQSLTFGRSDAELKSILDSAQTVTSELSEVPFMRSEPETWRTWPITPDLILISRQPHLRLTPAQIEAIQEILRQ